MGLRTAPLYGRTVLPYKGEQFYHLGENAVCQAQKKEGIAVPSKPACRTCGAEILPMSWVYTYLIYRRNTMAYTKPQVVAQNSTAGSYAAGCPVKERGSTTTPGYPRSCVNCERTQ